MHAEVDDNEDDERDRLEGQAFANILVENDALLNDVIRGKVNT